MKLGQPATMTHEDKRNGATTLFAALNILDGTVIGNKSDHHRHQEFITFLGRVDKEVTAEREIHAIVDNDSAHKHKAVADWLKDYLRWTLHFTQTSCSWMNAVEGFFGKLPTAVSDSVEDLKTSIHDFISLHKEKEEKPLKWTASPKRLVTAHQRGF